MPAYTFFCNSCQKKYEIVCSIKDYNEKMRCEFCGSKKDTHRLYSEDLITLNTSIKKSDNELKTLGDLANRNRDKMNDDQKTDMYVKHNSYKEEQPTKELPKGMSRIKKQPKTKWTNN
jgi:putative FmdB family regulatory protein